MELKCKKYPVYTTGGILLIEPNGIEISLTVKVNAYKLLLIEPNGIEINIFVAHGFTHHVF